MLIVMVGQDVAPSQAFTRLSGRIYSSEIQPARFVGNGTDAIDIEEMESVIKMADLVIIGISSSSERAAIEKSAAALAHSHNKKYGFYADIYGAHRREWMMED